MGFLDNMLKQTPQRGGVGSYNIDDEEQVAILAATANQGSAGRQGPLRQAEAQESVMESYKQAALEAAGTGTMRVPSNPYLVPTTPNFYGEPEPPPPPGPYSPEWQEQYSRAARAEQPISMQEYLTQAALGFDPLSGQMPEGMTSEELSFRQEVLQTLLGYQQQQEQMRLQAEEQAFQQRILPQQRAMQMLEVGFDPEEIRRITGVDVSDTQPDPESYEARMLALQEQMQLREVSGMERSLALEDTRPTNLKAALVSLGYPTSPDGAPESSGRDYSLAERAYMPQVDLFRGVKNFFTGGDEQDQPTADEALAEYLSNEQFTSLSAMAEDGVRSGMDAREVLARLQNEVDMANAQGKNMPPDTVAVIMAQLSPLFQAISPTPSR